MADQATKDMRKRIAKITTVSLLVVAILAGAALWWFFSARISIVAVRGESMEPTFHNGETIFLKQAYEVEKGMIVVFKKPANWDYMGDESPELIKRIVAGGDSTIDYDGGKLYVDGKEVYDLKANNYLCKLPAGYSYTLTSKQLFVMGDNHLKSLDSLRILCDNEKPETAYVPFLDTFAYGYQNGSK